MSDEKQYAIIHEADGDTISGKAKAGLMPSFKITGTRA